MDIRNSQKFDLHKRVQQKQLHRNQDIIDLISKKFSRSELQRRNSMFSGIDWSEVEIFEPSGYNWQPEQLVNSRA